MPLIACPDCHREHSDAAPACPHCARPANAPVAASVYLGPTKAQVTPLRTRLTIVVGIVALVAAAAVVQAILQPTPTSAPAAPAVSAAPPRPPPDLSMFMTDLWIAGPGVRELLPSWRAEGGKAIITVSDAGWYSQPCYKRLRLIESLGPGWKKAGGTEVELVDSFGKTLASFDDLHGVRVPDCK